jgi:lysine-specific histone demethylase 1
MWRQASEDEKRPYLEQAEVNRQTTAEIAAKWKADNAEWEKRSAKVKKRWRTENPYQAWYEKEFAAPPSKKVNLGTDTQSQGMTSAKAGVTPAEATPAHTVDLDGMTLHTDTLPSPSSSHTHPQQNGTLPFSSPQNQSKTQSG